MKTLILVFVACIAFACNEGTASKETTNDTAIATSTTPSDYPYTIEHPNNWEVGNTANTLIALKSLKAWEEGKMDESLKYFADSVHMEFDALDKKMSKDSVKAMFNEGWNTYKNVVIKMHDWESVISKDKKEEWVTLWYTQHWETKNGLKDSLAITNDFKIKDGKIIALEEYSRKLH